MFMAKFFIASSEAQQKEISCFNDDLIFLSKGIRKMQKSEAIRQLRIAYGTGSLKAPCQGYSHWPLHISTIILHVDYFLETFHFLNSKPFMSVFLRTFSVGDMIHPQSHGWQLEKNLHQRTTSKPQSPKAVMFGWCECCRPEVYSTSWSFVDDIFVNSQEKIIAHFAGFSEHWGIYWLPTS